MDYLNEHQSYLSVDHFPDYATHERCETLSLLGEYPLGRNSFKSFSSAQMNQTIK